MKILERRNLAGVDIARGIAASAVVLYHVARHIARNMPFANGARAMQSLHSGVDLFFIISGFIIFHVHARDINLPDQFGKFAARRFTRLYPTLWVALLATMAIDYLAGHPGPSLANLIKSFLLIPQDGEPILGVAWTLTYEIIFYLCFGALILNRSLGLALFVVWGAVVVLRITNGIIIPATPESISNPYNLEFFIGMGIASQLDVLKKLPGKLLFLGGAALFLLTAALETRGEIDGYGTMGRLGYGLSSAFLIVSAASWAETPKGWFLKALNRLGESTYSIYLFQFLWIGVVWKLALKLPPQILNASPVADFVVLSASAILGGVVISRLIEHPLMGLVRRALSRA